MKALSSILRKTKDIHAILEEQSAMLPEGFVFKHAVKDMATKLANFREKGSKQFESANPVTVEKEIRNIASFTSNDACYIVIEHNGNIVGAITGQVQDLIDHGGLSVYIGKLLVLKEYNGRGFATALMRVVEEWSIAMGIRTVMLSVYASNKNALHLYEHTGFEVLEEITYYDMVKKL